MSLFRSDSAPVLPTGQAGAEIPYGQFGRTSAAAIGSGPAMNQTIDAAGGQSGYDFGLQRYAPQAGRADKHASNIVNNFAGGGAGGMRGSNIL